MDNTPESYKLFNNYPNPFNTETVITYSIPKSGKVVISIYDLLGRKIKMLVSENKASGKHFVKWNGRDETNVQLPSGIYFYRMETEGYSTTKKMVLLK
jgi:flagellar hook assembly protein FlgD